MKGLSLIKHNGEVWVISNLTGEIVKPWELRKVFGLVKDLFTLK